MEIGKNKIKTYCFNIFEFCIRTAIFLLLNSSFIAYPIGDVILSPIVEFLDFILPPSDDSFATGILIVALVFLSAFIFP